MRRVAVYLGTSCLIFASAVRSSPPEAANTACTLVNSPPLSSGDLRLGSIQGS